MNENSEENNNQCDEHFRYDSHKRTNRTKFTDFQIGRLARVFKTLRYPRDEEQKARKSTGQSGFRGEKVAMMTNQALVITSSMSSSMELNEYDNDEMTETRNDDYNCGSSSTATDTSTGRRPIKTETLDPN